MREVSREIHDHGDGIRIAHVVIEAPDGNRFARRYLHTPDAVAIVAVVAGQLLLVDEYRAPAGSTVLQVPMGKIDGGRAPEACAHAELMEETGYEAARCEPVGTLLSCPGWLNQELHVFRAVEPRRLARRPAGTPDDVEEQHSRVVTMPVDEFDSAVRTGLVRDARTIAAVRLALT